MIPINNELKRGGRGVSGELNVLSLREKRSQFPISFTLMTHEFEILISQSYVTGVSYLENLSTFFRKLKMCNEHKTNNS